MIILGGFRFVKKTFTYRFLNNMNSFQEIPTTKNNSTNFQENLISIYSAHGSAHAKCCFGDLFGTGNGKMKSGPTPRIAIISQSEKFNQYPRQNPRSPT